MNPGGISFLLYSHINFDELGKRLQDLPKYRLKEIREEYGRLVEERLNSRAASNVNIESDHFKAEFQDADEALACALDIHRAVGQRRDQNPEDAIRFRTGLHWGNPEIDFVVAKEFAARAPTDGILVSSFVKRSVSHYAGKWFQAADPVLVPAYDEYLDAFTIVDPKKPKTWWEKSKRWCYERANWSKLQLSWKRIAGVAASLATLVGVVAAAQQIWTDFRPSPTPAYSPSPHISPIPPVTIVLAEPPSVQATGAATESNLPPAANVPAAGDINPAQSGAPVNSTPAIASAGAAIGPNPLPVPGASLGITLPSPAVSQPPGAICSAAAPALGTRTVSGPPVPLNPCGSDVTQCAQDVESCRARAEKLDPEAAAQLGYIYLNGLGVKPDFVMAKNWSNVAAAKGNALGQDTLGQISKLGGGGIDPDYILAHDLFAAATAQGCALAETDLGDLYLYGKGVEHNASIAVQWYQKAADQNDAMGQNNLAYVYNRGFGVERDPKQALTWYLKSAQQGNPYAQDALGYMYQIGLGVDRDPAQAMACYRKAAEQDYPEAQIHLAQLYEHGEGVPQDRGQAANLYCKAAAAGNLAAQIQARRLGANCPPAAAD